jgi:hypothetical protein
MNLMSMKNLGAVALLLVASTTVTSARETIVGKWAQSSTACHQIGNSFNIGPKSLNNGDDMFCEFRTVARNGDVVTWNGTCRAPETPEPATIMATLRGDRLDLGSPGRPTGLARGLRRCR